MRALACAVLAAAISGAAAGAQELPPQVSAVPIPEGQVETAVGRLDEIVADVRRRTGVPGIAVAVVSGGAVAFTKGYGVLEAGKRAPVDADTVFQLASVSKSVGATVVATRGRRRAVAGTRRSTELLPWFALADPRGHRDAHDRRPLRAPLRPARPRRRRPRGHRLRPAAVLERLRFAPLHGFRDDYAYTNFGLTAAAEAVAVAAGTDWATLSETAIYRPLGMTRTSSRFADYIGRDNRAVPHMRTGDAWAPREQREPDAQSPAGGVSSSVADMAKWMLMVLDGGAPVPPPEALLPAISPQAVSDPPYAPDARAGFYGFGFGVGYSPSGRVELSHSGGFYLGAATVFRLIPSAGVGIVVLSNAQPIGAVESIALSFTDLVQFGEVTRDWYATIAPLIAPVTAPLGRLAGAAPPTDPAPARRSPPMPGPTRTTTSAPIEIAEEGGGLVLKAGPQPVAYPAHALDRGQLRLRAGRRERPRRLALGGELPHGRRHRRHRDGRVLERRGTRHLHPLKTSLAQAPSAASSLASNSSQGMLLDLLAVDQEGRRRIDAVGLGVLLVLRHQRLGERAVLHAGVHLARRSARPAGRCRRACRSIACSSVCRQPSSPACANSSVDDAEVAVGRRAAGDHRRPEARLVEVDLAEDQPHLAGVDVVRLDLREDVRVEGRAVRAGEHRVLDQRHRRVRVAHAHLGDRARCACASAAGAAARRRRARRRGSGGGSGSGPWLSFPVVSGSRPG